MMRRAKATDYNGQRVLLVGLGVHGGGVATARWLVAQGAIVRITDVKKHQQLQSSIVQLAGLPIQWSLGGHQPKDWAWAQRIIVNPDVYPTLPALQRAAKRGIPIENEASIFLRYFPGRVIGVTGTRGKTTTTLLLGKILQLAHRQTIISGNIRNVPMLQELPTVNRSTWAVLELSSYQLERLPVGHHPIHVAIMTNLKVDHLNRHGSMSLYAQTKYNIFRGQSADDFQVLNWDDLAGRQARRIGLGQVVWFSRKLPKRLDGVTLRTGWIVEQKKFTTKRLISLRTWKLKGSHNVDNLLTAVAAARAMNITPKIIAQAVNGYQGAPYRQQIIRTYDGHRFINDTTATSPDATLAALATFPQALYILGGTNKELHFQTLARELVHHNIATVFLPGTATVKLQTTLRRLGYRRPLITVPSMTAAVKVACSLARPWQDIILSPGAASFGLFIHEFDRGEQFNQNVNRLV